MPRFSLRTLIAVMVLLPPVIGFVWKVGVEEAFLYLCWLVGMLGFASAAILVSLACIAYARGWDRS